MGEAIQRMTRETKETHDRNGVKVTAEEAKQLEAKAQETWHWKEVDLRDWASTRLRELFRGRKVVDTETEKVEIIKTELYGEAFATSRKGHTEATCNLDCRVYWRGELHFNGGVVGTANGTFKFPEVVASTPASEWPLNILADGEDPSAMRLLNPCGSLEETPLRELEPFEVVIRDAARRCEEDMRGLMAQLIEDMKKHAEGGILQTPEELAAKEGKGVADDEVSEKVKMEVQQKMEEMRVNALPEKLRETMDLLKRNENPPRVELSVMRITDTEAAQLGEALKGNTTVTHLNLSFNQIGDKGIQAFVTALASGAAKGLQVLKLDNNPFGEMGRRMLSGVSMMRKGLEVHYESAIGNVAIQADKKS